MRELCKNCLTYLFIFLFLASFSYALDECKSEVTTDEVPCHILLPINTSKVDCTLINVTFYNHTINIYNQTMTTYSPAFCNATFTPTNIGTYNFEYSTGDTGSIIVTEGNKMILLFYFTLIVLTLMAIVGFIFEDVVYSTITGFGLSIFGIYLLINGFASIQNLIVNFLSLIFIMLGLYFLVPAFEWAIHELNISG